MIHTFILKLVTYRSVVSSLIFLYLISWFDVVTSLALL